MIQQIFFVILIHFFIINNIQTISIIKRNHETFELLKQTKEKMKHGIQCLPPSKYYAGSCYTYMKTSSAPSWERAYNSCLSLPMTKDARLLAIESIDEYEFIERELIGLKSGSDSVSVYIGLHKMNSTWFWSNGIPLKDTPVYRFWVDNNRDILAYDCGILWLARNTSVITPAPCVEQALRPYVCKQIIDRCYNNSISCGKYGKCINLPSINSYKCQCRLFYTGDQCEKWSNQGLQILISSIIVIIAFIIWYIINIDFCSYKKSISEEDKNSSKNIILNIEKLPLNNQEYKYSIKSKKLILIFLSIILTIIICIIIISIRNYIKKNFLYFIGLFDYCLLYENNYYHHLLTLPISFIIILLIIFNQTRKEYKRLNKEKFSIIIPIPYNPFSKENRFDTMILCGIISYEILEIIQEIFLKTIEIKLLIINGPLFDLIRQIGFIIIIGLRYYPIYSVIEMSHPNILYYILCSFYMWLDFFLRIFQQIFCVNIIPLIQIWQKFEQLTKKYQTNSWISTTTMMFISENEEYHSEGFRNRFQRIKNRLTFKETTTTINPSISIPFHSLNWSSIDLNIRHNNNSQSIFEQFNIDFSTVNILKYAPYYLCLIYICFRLTYLSIINIYRSFLCCNKKLNTTKKSLKHIYHEPTFSSRKTLSIEYYYVQNLFKKSHEILIKNNNKKFSFIKSLLYKIYQPNKYFHYSKQILNMYIISFMLIYYLTFNILQNGFNLIEKIYSITLIPLLIIYDEIDLPESKVFNLKYEMILTCFITSIIYIGQLLYGMKYYQKHMLNAYKGIFIDIPSRSFFKDTRFISKNIHYPGYCIAYLTFGYIIIGNIIFFILITLRVLFKNLFLIEEIAKIFLPILVIYLTKFIIQWFLSRTFFLQKHGKTMVLKNLRIYFIFIYFNFFFDCFLGIISCTFRLLKAWITIFVYLPRLDYCTFGRSLEKMDSGFISYVSFIHMECIHTHPVLIYFCSIINEQINKRYQYFEISKRDIYLYTNHQRIIFRWWLAITLSRNRQLIKLRKHQLIHLQLLSINNLNNLLRRKVFNHCQQHRIIKKNHEKIDSNIIIRNHTTTCTTLLLDVDEQDNRKSSF